MKDKKYCKVVQDLLPNYIENLTNEETNLFIEEHLKECSECKEIYENMKAQLSGEEEKANKKEVNYLKKYNIKLRIFMGIVLAIVLIFVVGFVRKLVVFKDLQNKLEPYKNATNYFMKQTDYSEGQLYITQKFQKDDKYMQSQHGLFAQKEFSGHNFRIYGGENIETTFYIYNDDEIIKESNYTRR